MPPASAASTASRPNKLFFMERKVSLFAILRRLSKAPCFVEKEQRQTRDREALLEIVDFDQPNPDAAVLAGEHGGKLARGQGDEQARLLRIPEA
jgi:hypothetical protein